MFNFKIKLDNNEVVKNEEYAGIKSGEDACKISTLKALNLAGGFKKEIFNKGLLTKAKGKLALKATANDEGDIEPPNSNPNQAYPINMDVMYTDSITGKGKRRWYYFQLTEKKKVTAYMSPVADATVDNDLDLYKLDTTKGTLSVVAQSQNPASNYELLSYVAEPGYYFLSVAAFAGEIANQFSFMVRLSDNWDENEADDSLLEAKVQPLFTPVKHTLDNSIDQDLSILNVSEASNYSFALMKVADNVDYQLQIMTPNMQVIDIVPKNKGKAVYLNVGSYVIRLMSVDGSFDVESECEVLVSLIPSTINAQSDDHYLGIVTDDKNHFVEIMSLANLDTDKNPIIGVSIDGQVVDVNHIDFTATRYNTSRNGSECSISTSSDTRIIGVGICSAYFGSNQKSNIGVKNRLFLSLSPATYAESHYQVDAHDNHKNWANALTMNNGETEVILDMDTMKVVDIYMPNWYFGDKSICGYPAYGNKETPGIEFSVAVGHRTIRE